ncbi:MAG TPA: hypothetical protein PLK50_10065, partial [Ottowia sp.]|uniref:hypothetical protein n=1 Tax=Ottowia sp. TaxID=1898956 RepID=UPI002B8E7CA1
LDLVQAAVLLALAARRAHGVENVGFGHRITPWSWRDSARAPLCASIDFSPSGCLVKMLARCPA